MPSLFEKLIGVQAGNVPLTGTFSVDAEGKRFPSMVPGNTAFLEPAIRQGLIPRLTDEQVRRAFEFAQRTGNFKESSEPISPLGSEFDFFNPSSARLQDLLALGLSLKQKMLR